MQLIAIHTGQPRTMSWSGDDIWGAPDEWTSSIYKAEVTGPAWIGYKGVHGDAQADQVNHGGPDKAVNLYAEEHYAHWDAELAGARRTADDRAALARRGGFGENLTVRGLVETGVCIGDVYALGAVQLQVSQPRQPCWKLARRWRIRDFVLRVQQAGSTGWYARVLREGEVHAGDAVTRLARPHPEWTIAAANEVMHHRKHDREAAAALAACPALAANWKATLTRRAEEGACDSEARRVDR